MKTLAILFGGRSTEYEVSIRSAAFVYEAARALPDYDVVAIGITREGQWFLYDGCPNASWLDHPEALSRLSFSAELPTTLTVVAANGEQRQLRLDVVFPVLHGRNGEDGRLQGLLEMLGLPYVGCGVSDSALCMDKALAKAVLATAGVPQGPYLEVREADYKNDAAAVYAEAEKELGYPIFVKPANAGSSVGITKAHDRCELEKALELAFRFDRKILLEATIVGREIEYAVLERENDGAMTVSEPGEIRPAVEFYDYDAKYADDRSELLLPATVEPETKARMQAIAAWAFRALDCHGLSRVDFFLCPDGKFYLNEINTLPGFTSISMYPKLMELAGYSAPQLVERLLTVALERAAQTRAKDDARP